MIFRKANTEDIAAIAAIYEEVHEAEAAGITTCGWEKGVYPTAATAQAGVDRGDMFVCEEDGEILAAAVLNQLQVDVYADGHWDYPAPDDRVMVIHTLAVSMKKARKGIGSAFVAYYEKYAKEQNCPYLRMDTGMGNTIARALYKKLGYKEVDYIPCIFNGIEGVTLVLLEKYLG